MSDDDYVAKWKLLRDDYVAKRKALRDDYEAKLKLLLDDYEATLRLRIEVDRLKAENARLRADAERFIWLADRMARYAALVEVNPSDDNASDKNWFHIEQGEDLRVAIDAALSPQETPK